MKNYILMFFVFCVFSVHAASTTPKTIVSWTVPDNDYMVIVYNEKELLSITGDLYNDDGYLVEVSGDYYDTKGNKTSGTATISADEKIIDYWVIGINKRTVYAYSASEDGEVTVVAFKLNKGTAVEIGETKNYPDMQGASTVAVIAIGLAIVSGDGPYTIDIYDTKLKLKKTFTSTEIYDFEDFQCFPGRILSPNLGIYNGLLTKRNYFVEEKMTDTGTIITIKKL